MSNALIYISVDNEQRGPFTLGQLKAMWGHGQVTATALFFQEGMSDWRPILELAHLLEDTTSPKAPPQMPAAAASSQYKRTAGINIDDQAISRHTPADFAAPSPAHVITCPKCGKNDMLQKVSAVYAQGLSSGTFSGRTLGGVYSSGDGVMPAVGMNRMTGTMQTTLSVRLSPPPQPTKEGTSARAFIIVFIFFAILAAFVSVCFAAGDPTIKAEDRTSYWVFSVVCIVIAAPLSWIVINDNASAEKHYAKALGVWRSAMASWNRLYYCGRDDLVFEPPIE